MLIPFQRDLSASAGITNNPSFMSVQGLEDGCPRVSPPCNQGSGYMYMIVDKLAKRPEVEPIVKFTAPFAIKFLRGGGSIILVCTIA